MRNSGDYPSEKEKIMYPDAIFGFIHLYGLMIAVGILACFGLLFRYGKKNKIEEKFMDFVFYTAIAAIVCGFGSASLFQSFYTYLETGKWEWGNGITFIGGLIGGVATFLVIYFLFRKKYKTRLIDILSFIPCCILIAHAFGRVGCLFAGCCHGPKTDAWYGIYMHTSKFGYAKVVPTQLFEAIFLFALFAICFLLVWKKKCRHTMSVYLIAYGIFRFCLEFVRADDRGKLLGFLSPSQFWSIAMVIAGVALIFILPILYRKRDEELARMRAAETTAETTNEAETTEETTNEAQTTAETENDAKTENDAETAAEMLLWK